MQPVTSNGFEYAAVNGTNEAIATVVTSLILIGAVTAVIALCRRERIRWPILILVSGGLTCFLEPLFDHLYGLWFATENQTTAFTTFGVDIPIWLPIIYVPYYGAWTVYLIRRFSRGASLGSIAKLFGASVLLAGLAETMYIQVFGLYVYQDHQAFHVADYPIWIAVVNGVPPFLAAIAYVRLVPKVKGWEALALIPVVPMAFAADSFGTGWLYLAARHGSEDPSMVLIYAAAIFTVALAFAGVVTAAKLAGIHEIEREDPAPTPAAPEREAVTA